MKFITCPIWPNSHGFLDFAFQIVSFHVLLLPLLSVDIMFWFVDCAGCCFVSASYFLLFISVMLELHFRSYTSSWSYLTLFFFYWFLDFGLWTNLIFIVDSSYYSCLKFWIDCFDLFCLFLCYFHLLLFFKVVRLFLCFSFEYQLSKKIGSWIRTVGSSIRSGPLGTERLVIQKNTIFFWDFSLTCLSFRSFN